MTITREELLEALRLRAIRENERCGHLPYDEFIRCICALDDEDDQ